MVKDLNQIICCKDLWAIFYGSLSIGDYKEVIYYLPKALELINIEKDGDENSLLNCHEFPNWLKWHKDDLNKDSIYKLVVKYFFEIINLSEINMFYKEYYAGEYVKVENSYVLEIIAHLNSAELPMKEDLNDLKSAMIEYSKTEEFSNLELEEDILSTNFLEDLLLEPSSTHEESYDGDFYLKQYLSKITDYKSAAWFIIAVSELSLETSPLILQWQSNIDKLTYALNLIKEYAHNDSVLMKKWTDYLNCYYKYLQSEVAKEAFCK
ncbi:hypothetical protein AAEX28_03285 [Lentisphaerota bacterium WC36G]|nr:hypothetical protein LJT99_06160 [Lentisphaerae bacterium WC36]